MKTGVPLKDKLKVLEQEIENLNSSITPLFVTYKVDLHELLSIIDRIDESWSQSWIGSHASLYFKGYKRPEWNEKFDPRWGLIDGIPQNWEERSYDDITSFISSNFKAKDITEIEKSLNSYTDKAEELKLNLCTELSIIMNLENYEKEIEILREIEDIRLGIFPNAFIESLSPKAFLSSDYRSLSEGTKAPPHIRYQAKVLSLLSKIDSIENFIKRSRRLIRQIEIKENVVGEGTAITDSISNILLICRKFHTIARQLRSRHNDRPTLEIDDEYDVQDLLHSLLKIYFDDVRPEEWTPSYAGGSSRIDFLLKREKTVVEVKKTRKNLEDKEIGNQLLIDIVKYKQHPDCRTLICFVYDPEGRIGNPKGLSSDLDQRSDENMNIITVIEPS